ncbi:MAG: RNase adapter RapZ [Gammaproteobacteria bacterium]|nr:MAG: RNase adapter RapZ [Gammaproteobacteria bacterium]
MPDSASSKRLIIVTGLSGSGKSVALHTLEDDGYFCIDNLPAKLLPTLIDELLEHDDDLYARLAIGVDVRSERRSPDDLLRLFRNLRRREALEFEVLFLDTGRSTLVRRFSETRRRHPLSGENLPLHNAIDHEMRLLDPVKEAADRVIDTSRLNVHELRELVGNFTRDAERSGLTLVFQSFGFKHGVPGSTDFVFDVRCLPNPHWDEKLRRHTGAEAPVIAFLDAQPEVGEMYRTIRDFLTRWLPCYDAENRAYLTVSIGCTGGRHRSVHLVERLFAHFAAERGNVSKRHRELA